MASSPLDSLTRKERDCLRLVAHDRKSAVIAAELGIAVPTVETHLRSARAKLGGVSRFVAARMLLEHEANYPLTSHRLTIAAGAEMAAFPVSSQPETVGSHPLTMGDARPAFDEGATLRPIERSTGSRSRLGTLNRIALIAFCLLAFMVAGIAAIPLSNAVQDVARMLLSQRRD